MTTLDSKIFGPLFGDSEINELLTDEAYVRALVEVETALAKAEARLGVIPSSAAEQICSRTQPNKIDVAALAKGTARSGFPIIALVQEIRKAVGGEAASYVHWGATTQDIMDTAGSLQLRAVIGSIQDAHSRDCARSRRAFKSAPRHCLGRTHPWPAGAAGQLRLEGCHMACAFDSPRRAAG